MSEMINHKEVARDILVACDQHKLSNDAATKCLIYTASKLIKQRFKCTDVESAEMLSKAALYYRDQIKQIEKMFKNKG